MKAVAPNPRSASRIARCPNRAAKVGWSVARSICNHEATAYRPIPNPIHCAESCVSRTRIAAALAIAVRKNRLARRAPNRLTLQSVNGGRIAATSRANSRHAAGLLGKTAWGLTQGQHPQREQQAGKTDRKKGGLPAGEPERCGPVRISVGPSVCDPAAERQAKPGADEQAR